jgi:hypothetical protein
MSLRRLRFTAPELADLLGMPVSTISGILKRVGMGRLGRLGLEPAVRYERERPGELLHIDVKKLGRIGPAGAGHRMTGSRRHKANAGPDGRRTAGWEFVHVAIDDATRLAYVEVLTDEKPSRLSPFSDERQRSTPATASRSSDSSPTTAAPTARQCTRSRAASSGSVTYGPGPTVPRPTGKPNASSAPSSAAGPTARSTAPAPNAPKPLTDG